MGPGSAIAPRQLPVSRPLVRSGGLGLVEVACGARRGDVPFDEAHRATSIALVKRGVFTYRSRGRPAVLSPGWLMLGNAGEGYQCSHEHADEAGDDCLALELSGEILELVRSAL